MFIVRQFYSEYRNQYFKVIYAMFIVRQFYSEYRNQYFKVIYAIFIAWQFIHNSQYFKVILIANFPLPVGAWLWSVKSLEICHDCPISSQ